MNSNTFAVILMSALIVASCNNNPQKATADSTGTAPKDSIADFQRDRAVKLLNMMNKMFNKEKGPGGVVLYRDAKESIALWPFRMTEHGVGRQVPATITINRKQDITLAIRFGGKELLEWVERTVDRYDPDGQGDNIEFHIVYGVYTDRYIADHMPANERPHAKNRFTVFLVPFDLRTQKSIADDDTEVFNLGGLQP